MNLSRKELEMVFKLAPLLEPLQKLNDMAPAPCENVIAWAVEEIKRLRKEHEQLSRRPTVTEYNELLRKKEGL